MRSGIRQWLPLIPLTLWAAAPLFLASCGGGGEGGGSSAAVVPPLAGTWRVTQISALGQTVPCPGQADFTVAGQTITIPCGEETVAFNADGTFVLDVHVPATAQTPAGCGRLEGTWKLIGDQVTITATRYGADTNANDAIDASEWVAGSQSVQVTLVQRAVMVPTDLAASILESLNGTTMTLSGSQLTVATKGVGMVPSLTMRLERQGA